MLFCLCVGMGMGMYVGACVCGSARDFFFSITSCCHSYCTSTLIAFWMDDSEESSGLPLRDNIAQVSICG